MDSPLAPDWLTDLLTQRHAHLVARATLLAQLRIPVYQAWPAAQVAALCADLYEGQRASFAQPDPRAIRSEIATRIARCLGAAGAAADLLALLAVLEETATGAVTAPDPAARA
jgi:hypothetical protein